MTIQSAFPTLEMAMPSKSRQASRSKSDAVFNLAITKIPKIGHKNAKKLIAHFGSARKVFQASKRELADVFGIGDKRISEIKSSRAIEEAEAILTLHEKHGIKTLYFEDKEYPSRLREIEDGPIVIHTRGDADLNPKRMIAMVGTRKATSSGKYLCEKLIDELKGYHPTIVSGLAIGIDATSHRAALHAGLPTIGVVAHGLSDIYPARHRGLASKMLEQGGILSEFEYDTKAEREFFPMRNRIIAGLSDGLVVVQTARKGGSMISADLANAYHREVFAFPGRVGDATSSGGNLLIKNNRAQLIESAEDLAYHLGWDQPCDAGRQPLLFPDLSPVESTIVDLLKPVDALSFDQLAFQAKMPQDELSGTLLGLEFKQVLVALPGKRFALRKA